MLGGLTPLPPPPFHFNLSWNFIFFLDILKKIIDLFQPQFFCWLQKCDCELLSTIWALINGIKLNRAAAGG